MRHLGARDRFLALLAPLILCLAAGLGTYRVHAIDQSSWKGATFGMFATFENHKNRFFRVTATEAGATRRVGVLGGEDAEIDRARRWAQVVPTEGNVARLAEVVRDVEDADAVAVELWKIDFLPSGPEVIAEPVIRVEVPR